MTLQVGEFWYSETEYGPPLPHSLWLWEQWGCYEHYDCVCFSGNSPLGQAYHKSTKHINLNDLEDYIGYRCATNCECFFHWLRGDLAHKDYPQTYEPVIQQHKRGRRNNGPHR